MIEKLLNLMFKRLDIVNHRNNAEGELYLRRWFIWPRHPQDDKMKPRLYLHKFYTGDSDRHLHDHPWSFTSLILKGGYEEFSFNPAWLKWKAVEDTRKRVTENWANLSYRQRANLNFQESVHVMAEEPLQTVSKWYGPGSILRRGANWAHSVKLKTHADGSVHHCWSLVWTSVKSRSWGFHTENGWCWWRNYKEGACVCYDNPNEEIPNVQN